MGPTYYGLNSWKNHHSYDNRYPDDHPYNQKAWDIGHKEDKPTAKKKEQGFQPHRSHLANLDGNMPY